MRAIFFWKCLKFNVHFKKGQNNWRKAFCFWDKFIWLCCVKMPPLRREYLSSAVSVLENSLKTLNVTKSDFFQLSYLHSDQWIWWRCCRWDWNSALSCLPCCLTMRPLKRDFLGIYLTRLSRKCNFGNT